MLKASINWSNIGSKNGKYDFLVFDVSNSFFGQDSKVGVISTFIVLYKQRPLALKSVFSHVEFKKPFFRWQAKDFTVSGLKCSGNQEKRLLHEYEGSRKKTG